MTDDTGKLTAEFSIGFFAECSECRTLLEIEEVTNPNSLQARATIKIKPCQDCIETAREEAREEIYSLGDDE